MSHENERDGLGSWLSDAERSDIERRLAALAPAGARVDRDRLMFLAGEAQGLEVRDMRSEVRRRGGSSWLWPAAAMTLGATSLALLMALFVRPETQIVYRDREVLVEQPQVPMQSQTTPVAETGTIPITLAVAQRSPASIPTNNYVRTREVALRMGLDALGGPSREGAADVDDAMPETYGDWLQSLTATADREGGN